MTITYGSLFTGIGGFDLGFDRAGIQCAWQVEKDPHCLNLLNKYWPDVPKYGDITNVTGLPTVDLICGGFPCQDVSVAGNRKGLAGERSGLWFEFLRIITDITPQWIVIENVPGLLSSNDGRDFATILRGLENCGYWWAYRILDSQFFRVPQRRRRVFVVASLTRGLPQAVLFERESSPWDSLPGRETRQGVAGNTQAGIGINGEEIGFSLRNSPSRSKGDGGINTSFVISRDNGQGDPNGDNSGLSYSLNGQANQGIAFGGNNTKGPVSIATRCNAHPSRRYDFESETFICNTFNGYTGGADDNDAQGNHLVIAPTLSAKNEVASSSTQREAWYKQSAQMFGAVRRLTPLECERLQGFPDGWTEGQRDTQRYRQLGNAVTVSVAEWLGRRIIEADGLLGGAA